MNLKYNLFAVIRLLMLIIICGLAAACARPSSIERSEDELTRENHWSATLNSDDGATPLTIVVITGEKPSGPIRLVMLSSFGAVLGDCRLNAGKAVCRDLAPGAKPLTIKISTAINDILTKDDTLFTAEKKAAATFETSGWQASIDAENINYQRLKVPVWNLIMKMAPKS